jgi:hypothetical protein
MQRKRVRLLPARETVHRRAIVLLVLGVAFPLAVGAALATPGSGVFGPVQARGTLPEDLIVNSKSGVHLKTKGSADVVTQQIVIAGGGHTGWHSHPGPVLVTVKRGAMRVIYADDPTCEGSVYEVGDSFVDRGDENVHIARNVSASDELEFWATYLVPGAPGSAIRLDEAAPSDCA